MTMRGNDWQEDDWDHLIRKERAAFHAVESEWLALKSHAAAERFLLSLRHLARVLRKEFDPDQPRDEQGRWTDAGGGDDPLSDLDVILAGGLGGALGRPINLIEEEALGGHAIREHVGKSESQLKARISAERNRYFMFTEGLKAISSFESLDVANHYANETLSRNRNGVEDYVAGRLWPDKRAKAFTVEFGKPTGYEAYALSADGDSAMRPTMNVRVVVRRSPASEKGFSL